MALSAALLLFASTLPACDDGGGTTIGGGCEDEPCTEPLNCGVGTYDDGVSSMCVACPADHWCAGGSAGAVPHTVCTDDDVELSAPSASQDRVCGPPVECTDEQAERVIDSTITGVTNECCHLHVGNVTVENGEGWPEFDENCLVVEGDVTITGDEADNVGLARVEGYLNLNNYNADNLKVISSLNHVIGSMTLNGLAEIENYKDLSGLQIITRSLSLGHTLNVSSLEGLGGLHLLGGIDFGADLGFVNYAGLDSLSVIGDDGVAFHENTSAPQNFHGLEGITAIHGTLMINQLANLTSFDGWSGLESVGSLTISDAGTAEDLSGFSALVSIKGGFSIQNNARLISLKGLENITETSGFVSVGANQLLDNLDDIQPLLYVGGGVGIRSNPLLCEAIAEDYITNPARTIEGSATQANNGTDPMTVCP